MVPNGKRLPADLGQDSIAADRTRHLNTLIGLSEKSVHQSLGETGLHLMPPHLIFERSKPFDFIQ
jgi:hypothetical protein